MGFTLDYSVLKKKLDTLPSCDAEGFFDKTNPYLRDRFLFPILQGKSVSIGDLDFSQFDGSDIDDLRDVVVKMKDVLGSIQRASEKIWSNTSTVKTAVQFL